MYVVVWLITPWIRQWRLLALHIRAFSLGNTYQSLNPCISISSKMLKPTCCINKHCLAWCGYSCVYATEHRVCFRITTIMRLQLVKQNKNSVFVLAELVVIINSRHLNGFKQLLELYFCLIIPVIIIIIISQQWRIQLKINKRQRS